MAIAQTPCLASFRHASKPVQLKSYFNLSPGSLGKTPRSAAKSRLH
jgi:hypothetical protein